MGALRPVGPTLALDPEERSPRGLGVNNLDLEFVASLVDDPESTQRLESLFRVSVVQTGPWYDGGLPDVLGRYEFSDREVRFVPLFPFEPGVSYRASFNGRALGFSKVESLQFSLEHVPGVPPAVERVYPSSDSLPENLLRFYVCFSNPMQRGQADRHIALLGPSGEHAEDVLYRAPVELWDKRMQCLTILLDPGRLKRGVGPNRQLGPPLRVGQDYTLEVGTGMVDLSGRSLPQTVRKRFRVIEAVRYPVILARWQIEFPISGTLRPLILVFPRPLDWALLSHSINVVAAGRPVDGRVAIDMCEMRWSFTPASPWTAGHYEVNVASGLEDVCGNDTMAAFDRPLRTGGGLATEFADSSLPFVLT